MKVKPLKIKIKQQPPTAAERLYQRHQAIRKEKGLPDPSEYKKKLEGMKEDTEQLDEMPESSMKTRDVHSHLKKAGWAIARTGGGHDIYSHPQAKRIIAVPRHKQLKAPLIKGILKASKVSEETEIEEQLEKKGRFVSGPPKKTFKAPTIVSPIKEAKDPREYDYEGDMVTSQLRSMIFNAQDLIDMMDDNTNLPEWVQSKITLAEDYISTAANYLRGELTEEVVKEGAGMGDNMYEVKHKHIETGEVKTSKVRTMSPRQARQDVENHYSHNSTKWKHIDTRKMNEEVEYLEEKNVPTNPELWSRAKAMARSKFDVYPSAYANGWAAKWYKSKGGGWKTVSEEAEEPSMAARTLSRKAQIVKDAAKSKKIEKEEASDKFQKDPELSSDIQKT